MLSHRGFSAWITVDGTPLPEYLVAVDEPTHRVSCWIPGEEGKTFTVWWSDHGGKVDTCSFITLDGLVVPGRFLLGEGTASRSGVRSSHLTERPFMFTKVTEDAVEDTEGPKQDVGTIVLKIKRVNRVESRPANAVQPLPTTPILGKRKRGELCVGFGAEQSTFLQYSSTWKVTPHDKTSSSSTKAPTFVSFVFRYRSPEFLEAQGIATAAEIKKKPSLAPVAAPDPRAGEKRRVASLPPPTSEALLATPSPSPPKRPRLTGPVLADQAALGHGTRKPSSELRRVVSYRNHSLATSTLAMTPGTPKANPETYSRPPSASSFHPTLYFSPRNEHHRLPSLNTHLQHLIGSGSPSLTGMPSLSALSDVTSVASDEDESTVDGYLNFS